jgi:hypothetical protein
MDSQPSYDPLIQQLQLLLSGYGYNFYNAANQARSDDLLVRERASYFLGQAINQLTTLRSDFHRRFVPPATRENPFPPQEAMARLRDMEEVQQTISRLESHIRGMSVPTQDRIWWRFRQEQPLLEKLLSFDFRLVRESEQLHQVVMHITPDDWMNYGANPLRAQVQALANLASERERFLLLQI